MDFESNDKNSIKDEGGKDFASVRKDIDVLLEDRPEELQRIKENRAFAKEFEVAPIKKSDATVKSCGIDIDMNGIIKLNLENWTVFTMNSLCDMFVSWRLEQLKKYLSKKKTLDFNYAWLIILIIIGLGGLIFFLVYIMPRLGAVL